MPISNSRNFGSPGGFDPERAEKTNQALHEILGNQDFEVEQRKLGKLALIRCALVGGSNAEYLLIERFLRTGVVSRRTSNSFEVTYDTESEENGNLRLVTDFRYLPYRDGLTVTRHLDDSVTEPSTEVQDKENKVRFGEILSGVAAATPADWSEFRGAIDDMRFGKIVPVNSRDLFG